MKLHCSFHHVELIALTMISKFEKVFNSDPYLSTGLSTRKSSKKALATGTFTYQILGHLRLTFSAILERVFTY